MSPAIQDIAHKANNQYTASPCFLTASRRSEMAINPKSFILQPALPSATDRLVSAFSDCV